MEFKEAMKIRERMCNYHKECKDCPLNKLADGCIDAMIEVGELDEYEKILEGWAKEHPVMTNIDKYIDVMKNTFGGTKLDKDKVRQRGCLQLAGREIDSNKCANMSCLECLKWWDEEYKEPAKKKEK